jgi:hypothetical protein
MVGVIPFHFLGFFVGLSWPGRDFNERRINNLG